MGATNHLVSVILPVRNGACYLAEALDSVAAQTYRPYELIVVDGGSTDGSLAVAQARQPDRLLQQAQPGLWAAFNLGVQAASGEYVAFISSDDRWTPDKLARQAAYLDAHPEAQGATGQVIFFVAEGQPAPRGFRQRLIGQPLDCRQMEVLLLRRQAFATVGLFDESLAFASDTDWFARAQDAGLAVAALPGVMLYKRLHSANLSLSAPLEQQRDLLHVLHDSVRRKRDRA